MLMSNGYRINGSKMYVYIRQNSVEKNTNPDWDVDYTATFVYEDKDARDAERVTVSGNFQFYSLNDPVVKNYEKQLILPEPRFTVLMTMIRITQCSM